MVIDMSKVAGSRLVAAKVRPTRTKAGPARYLLDCLGLAEDHQVVPLGTILCGWRGRLTLAPSCLTGRFITEWAIKAMLATFEAQLRQEGGVR